jgi:hypothetical protein
MRNTYRNKNLIKNNKGQAVLEYVFLTFMVLVVLLSIIIGISRSTKKFAENYFGAYFQCLLEVGELPSLGADGVSSTECDDAYEPFTLADGWKSKGFDQDPSQSDDSEKDGADKKDSNSDGSNASSSGASEGSGNLASSSYGDFGSRNQKIPLSNADKRGSSKGGSDDLGNTSAKNNFEQPQEFGEDGSGRSEYIPIYGSAPDEEKKDGASLVKADSQKDPEQELRGKRIPANSKKAEEGKVKEDDGVSFPDFIKYLIITAIILIILIFFGGQVMQYQKSQD